MVFPWTSHTGFTLTESLNSTYEETGVFFLGEPPTGGFLFDLSGELDPVTDRSGKNRNKRYSNFLRQI